MRQTRSQTAQPRLIIHLPRRAAPTSAARSSNTTFEDGPDSQQILDGSQEHADPENGRAQGRLAAEQAESAGASQGYSPQVKHHYGTRRSTRTVRPHALGHHKRTEDDNSQAAAESSTAKESQRDMRARKAQQRTQGMKELARLEDERIAEEAAEDEAMCAPAKGASARITRNTSPMSAASSRANQQLNVHTRRGSDSSLVQRPSRRWDETSSSEDDLAQAVASIKSASKTKRELQALVKRAKQGRPLLPTPSPERRAHFNIPIPPNVDAESLARRRRERRDRAKSAEANSGEDSEGPRTQARRRSRTPFRVSTPPDEDAEPDRNYYGENVDAYGQVIDDHDNPEDVHENIEHIDEDADVDGQYAADEDDERYEHEWGNNEPQDDEEEDEPQDDGEEDELQDDEPHDDEPQDDEPYDDEEQDELQDDNALQDEEDEEQGEYGLQDEDEQAQDSDSEPMGALQTKGKLSASQRRHVKRTNVRRQIDSYSQRASTSRHTSKRRRESYSPPRPPVRTKKGKNNRGDAFRPNWDKTQPRREPPMKLQQARTTSQHSSRARTSSRPHMAQAKHWRDAALSLNHPLDDSDDERASSGAEAHARIGFRDSDVAVDRASAVVQAARRSKMKVVVETIDDDDASETERTGQNPRRKRPRRSPSEIPEDESRSTVNVPHFLKPVLTSKIIPTVLDYFGAKKNPWNMRDHGRTELLDLCQQLINDACPHADYELTKSDTVYKVIRQAVYDWRAGFANTAVSAVDAAIDQKFGPKPNRKIVKLWVRKATSTGGESLWAKPHTKPERARGALQSKYVLKAFAHHLTATEGSMYDFGYPCGALALAATAVKHIFPMFASGTFKAGKSFSAANVEHMTDSWYRKRVRRLVKKPEVFLAIIRMASTHTDTSGVCRTPTGAADVPDIFDRSSSPVRVEEDDTDI